jgi:hypothetical protein
LQTEVGKVVNLMSADITQIMTFCFPFLSTLVTAPLTIIGATIFMITQIKYGPSTGISVWGNGHVCELVGAQVLQHRC